MHAPSSMTGVSPVLANIYLHYVVDLWFHRKYAKSCRGEEAERFYEALKERLGKFNLELSPEKSGMIRFDRERPEQRFEFLGFEYYWSRDRNGRPGATTVA